MVKIEDLTVGQVRELLALFGANQPAFIQEDGHPWQIGKVYLIRTVTMVQTGRLVRVTKQELVLEDAAWIADTGRFSQALATLNFNEVEPFPDGEVIVGRGSIIDAVVITQAPRSLK